MTGIRKRAAVVLLAAAMLLAGAGSIGAEQREVHIPVHYAPLHYEINGLHLMPPADQQGFIYKDNTYVPLRFLAYALDKVVNWDSDTYTVTVGEPSLAERIQIYEYKLNHEAREVVKQPVTNAMVESQAAVLHVYEGRLNFVFDGQVKVAPEELPGFIYRDRVYVPLRFMSESLGLTVEWDPDTYTVWASTDGARDDSDATDGAGVGASPSPAPSPSPGTGGSGGSGGGGVPPGSGSGTVRPSYQSILLPAMLKLYDLRERAEVTFRGYQELYQAAAPGAQRDQIVREAEAALDNYEAEFAGIVDKLEADLKAYSYSTDIVAEIRLEFATTVQNERARLGL